jgi:hypothetical protein
MARHIGSPDLDARRALAEDTRHMVESWLARFLRPLSGVLAAILCLGVLTSAQAPTEKGRLGLALTQITAPWKGDLDGMVERRMVRVRPHSARPSTSSIAADLAALPTTRAGFSKST